MRKDVIEQEKSVLSTFNRCPFSEILKQQQAYPRSISDDISRSLSSQITLQFQVTRWELPAVLVLNHCTSFQLSFK